MRLYEFKLMPFNSNPDIGWWQDHESLRMYHGTNQANLKSIFKNGVSKKDPETGLISLAFEPNTARGYASMYGGEATFRQAGDKAEHVPMNERVVIVMNIPMHWINHHMDPTLSGNIGEAKERLLNKKLYDEFDGPDYDYYKLAELRVDTPVPPRYIVGYMQ